jgi:lipoprotein-anchoring transpeptidase ErfK/SrfK
MYIVRLRSLPLLFALLSAFCFSLLSNDPVLAQRSADVAPAKRIEINLSSQLMILWEDDRPVKIFPTTTGREDQPTVPGQYEVLDKELNVFSSGWQLNMPFWIGIYKLGNYENGIHALPTDNRGVEYWRDALGQYPATHGCVALAPDDAELLFNWAEIGTAVEIHE